MSGIWPPPTIPTAVKDITSRNWISFFRDLISRKPQYEEVHLISAGIVYLGDSETNGSWRMVRSGNNLLFQRKEAGSWVTKSTISA